ncbi:MAG TPA: putative baseplate assembly protein, partial [Actinomycetota bacterium]|nr:putative baseplate assembly protein [Actinomycetota bacterium]
MALQYRCDDDRRRLAAVRAHPVLNGIEVLEVLDHDAPPGIPRQQSLLVSCVKEVPDDLSRENARIDGGVRPDPRLNPVRVLWAAKASAVATLPTGATLTAADQAFFPGLPDADHVLVVRTDRTGDLSTYRLRLVRSPNDDRPLDGFDPILSEVPFSFKVECPTDFDCKVDAE